MKTELIEDIGKQNHIYYSSPKWIEQAEENELAHMDGCMTEVRGDCDA